MVKYIFLILAVICNVLVFGYINPIVPQSGGGTGGPSIEKYLNNYYLVENDGSGKITIRTSSNLHNWTSPTTILTDSDNPAWLTSRGDRFECPELFISPYGQFYVYFDTEQHCIGVAVSNSSYDGPYTILDTPLLCSPDARRSEFTYPSTLLTDGGELILYIQNEVFQIEARTLGWDFISFADREVTTILEPDVDYNNLYLSSSRVFKRGNIYYLVYSADFCKGLYLARSFSPYGPFERQGDLPLNTTSTPLLRPKHIEVIVDEVGNHALFTSDLDIWEDYCTIYSDVINGYTFSWGSDEWPYLEN